MLPASPEPPQPARLGYRDNALAQYEAAFREHKIDSKVLPDLAESDLEKLGIPLGHRRWKVR